MTTIPKYIYSKKIMIPTLILIILLFAYVINIEGWTIFLLSRDIICPNQSVMGINKCSTLTLGNGTNITLTIGQTYHINPHNQKNMNLLNYGATAIAIIGFLINGLLYNKKYPYKAKILERKKHYENTLKLK
ncbi:MAG TPA: hypothetical protein VMQ58_02035 [Candidatus Saccharimonadales bacterium]|nr:hypothetical protein [Candidatus Saccharimonadales bacterium]